MKTIKLEKLKIENFKGIRNLEFNFNDKTNVHGANGVGKTTLFDAFTWVLFGKNSQGDSDFNIKTLDVNNNVIEQINHIVEATLLVDNEHVILKKELKEKWVKKSGALEPTFQGNEIIYSWNEVPLKLKDYTEKINDLINEDVFKLITSPTAFNALKWQDRRIVVTSLIDQNNDFINGDLELKNILLLTEKKSIDELKAENSAKIKKTKEELKFIPTRVDEVEKSKPDPIDYESVRADISGLNSKLSLVIEKLKDSSKSNETAVAKRVELQNKIQELKTKQHSIDHSLEAEAKKECEVDTSKIDLLKTKKSNKEAELTDYNNALLKLNERITLFENDIKEKDARLVGLRDRFKSTNASKLEFNDEDFKCSCCDRAFETNDIEGKKEELTTKFNLTKIAEIDNINKLGKEVKEEKETNLKEIETLKERLKKGTNLLAGVQNEIKVIDTEIAEENKNVQEPKDYNTVLNYKLEANTELKELKSSVITLESELSSIVVQTDVELENEANEINSQIKEKESILVSENQIKQANNRIKELKESGKTLSIALSELEKIQYHIERFVKTKITAIESEINGKFSFVKFRMFKTQVNGSEVECCDILINGVPFSDANTASKINAGLDIINTLSSYYKTYAPIFIDNRESVTKTLETRSQVINLIVDNTSKKLEIK